MPAMARFSSNCVHEYLTLVEANKMDHTYLKQNLPHILRRLAVRCKVWLDTDTKNCSVNRGFFESLASRTYNLILGQSFLATNPAIPDRQPYFRASYYQKNMMLSDEYQQTGAFKLTEAVVRTPEPTPNGIPFRLGSFLTSTLAY